MAGVILVPLDGSALAEESLPIARAIASRLDARLQLLRVVPPLFTPPRYTRSGAERLLRESVLTRQSARAYLDEVGERLAREGIDFSARLIDGDAAEQICDEAARLGARYIVMATHGYGGLRRLALGSVARAVTHDAPSPVVLWRGSGGAGRAPSLPFRRILVALDGSEASRQILTSVTPLAHAFGAGVVLFHAVHEPGAEPPSGAGVAPFRHLVTGLRLEGIRAELRLGAPPAAGAILEAARDEEVDLIAMTTHARPLVARALLGSVSDAVLRAADTPVLLARPLAPARAPRRLGTRRSVAPG